MQCVAGAHWGSADRGCAWSCCSAERREGGIHPEPSQISPMLWRAGEELFSILLHFLPLCLFLSFFVCVCVCLTGRTLIRLHHTPLSPLLSWREARPLLLKVTLPLPPVPAAGARLVYPPQGYGSWCPGASTRLPIPLPAMLPVPSPHCLPLL